ncbi:MAG: molybdopterin-guanine dinucleotide biosynthesis protein B [Candidatus Thorarchaeota archaeon]
MRVFAISGFSGTGKTTLIESIVKDLVSRNFTVATIKSSQHEPTEGKETDTERHKLAGAIMSYFRGLSDRKRSLRDIVNSSVADYLIVEGMKSSPIPKVWCIGNSNVGDTIPIEVKAIISWDVGKVEDKYGIPVLASDDIEQIVKIVMRESVDLNQIDV